MSLNNIYTYWEGKEYAYIGMCYETLIKNRGASMNVYRMSDYCGPYKFQSINHKTDWMKANLIYENGGFWIDADMIVTNDLSPLIALVEKHGFAGIPGFFGAKPGNKILGNWISNMRTLLESGKELVHSALIRPLLDDKNFDPFGVFTRDMICPIYHTGDEFWKFFENLQPEEVLAQDNYIVTLYNSSFDKEFKRMDRQQLLDTSWLLSRIFKKYI